mgnify:CR=1 FL=1
MAIKKKHLGKVKKNILGYTIRIMLDGKGNPNGLFGLYKGKNLLETHKSESRLEVIIKGIYNKLYTYRKYWCPNCP